MLVTCRRKSEWNNGVWASSGTENDMSACGGLCKKYLQQRSEGGNLRDAGGLEEEDVIKLKAPVEIELKLDSQQIESYRNIVEEMFGDEAQKSN
ncbi:promotilin-like isoform X2 [Hyperolius riggenbachi]|uniref:promotilin-like isoform X2 n=1 Tax=Hyperolius riggenbachi TaxID=752182 RepID=UPI0035A2CF7B